MPVLTRYELGEASVRTAGSRVLRVAFGINETLICRIKMNRHKPSSDFRADKSSIYLKADVSGSRIIIQFKLNVNSPAARQTRYIRKYRFMKAFSSKFSLLPKTSCEDRGSDGDWQREIVKRASEKTGNRKTFRIIGKLMIRTG